MKRIEIGALLLAMALFASCSRENSQGIAKVGEDTITKEEYYKRLERIQIPIVGLGNQPIHVQAGLAVLDRLIKERILLEKAKKEGVFPTEVEVQQRVKRDMERNPQIQEMIKTQGLTVDDYANEVRQQLASFKLQTKGVTVTEKEVKEFFEANRNRFRIPTSVKVNYISVRDPKIRQQIDEDLQRLFAFSTLVEKYRQNPVSGVQGGNTVINMEVPNMPPAIRKALLSVRPGQVTSWLRIRDEWVKFELLDLTTGRQQTYEEVKDDLREALMLQKGQQRNRNFDLELMKEMANTKIEILLPYWKEPYAQQMEKLKRSIKELESKKTAQQPRTNPVAGSSKPR